MEGIFSDERIRKYIKDQLSADELESFEVELLSNLDLKQEVEFQRKLIVGLKLIEDQRLRKSIKKVNLRRKVQIRGFQVICTLLVLAIFLRKVLFQEIKTENEGFPIVIKKAQVKSSQTKSIPPDFELNKWIP